MIHIPEYIFNECVARARQQAPIESCGLFGGVGNRVSVFYAMTNTDNSPEHFSLDPRQQFFVIKDLRKRGLKMIGVVHSHPVTPARMSKEDKRLSVDPEAIYFILSLAGDEPSMKAFRRNDDGSFAEVPLSIVAESDPRQVSLPPTVIEDVRAFRRHVQNFVNGVEDKVRFRAYRVPMGFYEQRKEDTYMARVRVTGGVLNATQLRTLADVTDKFGNGLLHLTTRQDVQIHDVLMPQAADLVDALLRVGLVCRGGGGNTVRNVTADPLAGIARDEAFDVTPYAVAATEYLIQSRSSFNLPRKFKIAFSGSDEDRAKTLVADLGFIARILDRQHGFTVFAGGGMGSASRLSVQVMDFLPAENLCHILEAVKRVFDRHGDRRNRTRARLRFVLERFGEEKFTGIIIDEFNKVLDEGIEVVEPRLASVRDLSGEEVENPAPFVIPQNVPGLYALTLQPLLGDITSATARALADIVEKYRLELRATHGQGFVLRDVRGQDLDAVISDLKKLDNRLLETALSRTPVACAGASTCKLGLCLSRNLASKISAALQSLPDETAATLPRMFISGCANACGQHPIGELSFSGHARRNGNHLAPFYRVWVGSQRGENRSLAQVVGTIPARAVPDFIRELALTLESRRRDGEDFMSRVQPNDYALLKSVLEKFSELPAYEANPLYYRDIGQDSDFTLAGRGPGECGAGVLDVIELDIEQAKEFFRAYQSKQDDHLLYKAAIAAMRSLLILRGVDSQKDREIMIAFREHLINEGWVSPSYADLIDLLLDFKLGDIRSIAESTQEIDALINRVEELFRSLDSSLNFTVPPMAKAADTPEVQPKKYLADLRGVPCPMNFVKAKLQLEKIPVGEVLEIVLDDGPPVANVPASFANEGHEVLDIEHFEENLYKVRVKRVK